MIYRGYKPIIKQISNYLKGNIYLVLLYRLLLMLFAFSFCRFLFYVYNQNHFSNIPGNELLVIFTSGLLFDTSAIVYCNLLYIVLYLLPLKFRHHKSYQNILMIIFFITNGIALVANFADIPYYEFVLQRTTADTFAQFRDESNLLRLVFRFLLDYWYLTLLWILTMTLLIFLYRKVKVGPPKLKSGLSYFIVGLIMFAVGIGLSVAGARGGFKQFAQPITMNNAWLYVKKPANAAIVLNTPFTLIHSFEKKGFEKIDYFSDEEKLKSVYSPEFKPSDRPLKKENIVIIIVESLNREFVGALNKDLENGMYKGFTPFLDSIVGVSSVFNHSFANGRKSIDILPSLFCSIPSTGIPYVLRPPYYRNELNSLPGLLKDLGYKSAFFHGAPNGSFGFESFTHIIGFDEYYGLNEYNNIKDYDGSWGIWDEEFLQYFANTIDTFSTPFLASVFTLSSHHPFALPERYSDRFIKGEFPLERCIEYTDFALSRFFQKVSSMPWYKNTLFVITADHVSINQRQEFQNELGHFSVPIIFFKPGCKLGLDSTLNAQQIDIMPTLLHYVGYSGGFVSFGKDLFNKPEKNFAYNYLNNTYRLFMDDKLLVFNGKEINSFSIIDKPCSLMTISGEEYHAEKDSMQLFLKAYIQQYVNRIIDNRLTYKPEE